ATLDKVHPNPAHFQQWRCGQGVDCLHVEKAAWLWQATRCPSGSSVNWGSCDRQRSSTYAHRLAKAQPMIGSLNDGTWPGISARRRPESFPSEVPRFGMAASNPRVYGCLDWLNSAFTEPSSTLRPAYIT